MESMENGLLKFGKIDELRTVTWTKLLPLFYFSYFSFQPLCFTM